MGMNLGIAINFFFLFLGAFFYQPALLFEVKRFFYCRMRRRARCRRMQGAARRRGDKKSCVHSCGGTVGDNL
jgi:hypothetical protein